jgi:dipeptidyl aminopeptidase/acylaminoacyl peptidase
MSAKKQRQFGLWKSPISPVSMASGLRISDVGWDENGSLVWHEGRSDRGALVVLPPDGQAMRDLNSDFSVRAKVGYGGGEFGVGQQIAYFVEAELGHIFRQPLEFGQAMPITPAFGRAAAPCVSPDGNWLLFVHSYQGQDCLAIVDSAGKFWPQKLDSGNDFYMQPTWGRYAGHQASYRIAWVAWDHPNMPWDGTCLRFGRLQLRKDELPSISEVQTMAGGENISIFQPEFSPDGRHLAYVSDESGWWQIYWVDLEDGSTQQLTDAQAEHGVPAWVQGLRTYQFSPAGDRLFYLRSQDGVSGLWQLDLDTGQHQQLQLDPAYTSYEQIAVSRSPIEPAVLAVLASGDQVPLRLITIPVDQTATQAPSLAKSIHIVKRTQAEEIHPNAYASSKSITWAGMDGEQVYGLFYNPQNEHYEGIGKPPLMLLVHGGPTSQRGASFNSQVQFFTSRGYAVLDVNYRGSTGYGRSYRDALKGKWGIYDVQDSVSGAQFLADRGLVDGGKLVIMGGSAGGFTALKALEDYPGFFKAGVCLYAVSNQFTLAAETHKFEAHYSDSLIGPLPEASDSYYQRSPIFFVDKIQDPVAVYQGEVDQVVPRKQSDEVVESLKQRNVPHIYHVYPDEGHGFRKPETIEHFYKSLEQFLYQYVIYA